MAIEHRRRSIRLPGYDYRTPGSYFVTICTDGRESTLEEPAVRRVVEEAGGDIPAHFSHAWLDAFVVMPNHLHGILQLKAVDAVRIVESSGSPMVRGVAPGSLSAIVRSFKSATTKALNARRNSKGSPVWQRNYWEHIIKSEPEMHRTREYIANNPANWRYDAENPSRDVSAEYLKAWAWVEGPQGAAVLRPYADLPNR